MPKWDEANPYQKCLAKELVETGCEVSLDDYDRSIFPVFNVAKKYKVKRKKNIIHLHWISQIVMRTCWSKNIIVFKFKLLCLFIDLKLCQLIGFKLIWTIHNKFSHEQADRSKEVAVRRLFATMSDGCIVHSKEAIEVLEKIYGINLLEKTKVVEHASYIGVYPEVVGSKVSLRKKLNINVHEKVILFFGSIKKYKGVEKFIELANSFKGRNDIQFLLIGEVVNEEYKIELLNKIEGGNIQTNFEFLEEQLLINYIAASDAVLLPFSDTLTSGSLLLAMSQARAVFLPELGRVFGCFPDDYPYYYSGLNDLKKLVDSATQDEFLQVGSNNFETVKKRSWALMAEKTILLYEDVGE